jgi:uncharacterized HAD superfamily protein/hypoxanthine phosphoribosyltransferase
LNYRNVDHLNGLIIKNLHRLPDDVDLIVGVPRSGMLPATLLALHSNRSMTDLQSYLDGRILRSGSQRAKIGHKPQKLDDVRRALVIDDSVLSGSEMSRVRAEVDAAGLSEQTLFATAYCAPGMEHTVDLSFDVCPAPRVFEWNLMHGHVLPKCCVDIDGVLCVDPSEDQNDDGPLYRDFLANATPLWRPTGTIGMLVTSRLEKYRDLTAAWMAKHNIQYNELVMMQYDTMEERKAAKAYGSFKADVYANSDKTFFIESNEWTTAEIARLSGKPAFCIETQKVYSPSGTPYAKQKVIKLAQESRTLSNRVVRKLKTVLG